MFITYCIEKGSKNGGGGVEILYSEYLINALVSISYYGIPSIDHCHCVLISQGLGGDVVRELCVQIHGLAIAGVSKDIQTLKRTNEIQ